MLQPKEVTQASSKLNGNITPWLVFSTISVAFGSSFQFGYNTGVLNIPQNIIGLWIRRVKCARSGGLPGEEIGMPSDLWCKKLDMDGEAAIFKDNGELNTLWALVNCLLPAGSIISALSTAFFIKRFGPKGTLLLNSIIGLTAATFESLALVCNSHEMLIIGRFIAGLNSGINAAVPVIYLTEISPANLRGVLGTIHQLFVVSAMFISQVLGLPFLLGNSYKWPLLLTLAGLPSFLQLAMLPFCPESPKYLFFEKQDENGAREALQKLRQSTDIKEEMEIIRQEYVNAQDDPPMKISDLLMDPFLRRVFLIIIGAMACQIFSGIDAVVFYSTAIFRSAGLSGDSALYATVGRSGFSVLMVLVSGALIDRAGRRMLLLVGYAGTMMFGILLTVCMLLFKSGIPEAGSPAETLNPYQWTAYGSSISLVGFAAFYVLGPNSIPWILMAEMFSQGPRAAAAGVATAFNRLCSVIVSLAFPYLQAAMGEYCFIVFPIMTIFIIIWTYFFIVETKEKSIEEIQLELRRRFFPNKPDLRLDSIEAEKVSMITKS